MAVQKPAAKTQTHKKSSAPSTTATLWNKGYILDERIATFITGNDYKLDTALVKADCAASCAHAFTLARCGVLTNKETAALKTALARIYVSARDKKFTISARMEDCHTAIETALTKTLGNTGKKIHTGRSRNDQAQAALRLYFKESLLITARDIADAALLLLSRAGKNVRTPMAGRTHMQIAMPSTVGLYLASYAEQLTDDLDCMETALYHVDRSPLGSGAGYGVPPALDRAYTARLLGFASVQNNVLAVQNSRGRIETQIIDALGYCATTLSRFAEDFIIYTLPEFNYFSLPQELCSGSSIMPQKKNPDVLELLRAYASVLSGYSVTTRTILKGLPSGYQRDVQLTKEPALRAAQSFRPALAAFDRVAREFSINKKSLERGFTPEIYATDEAYRLTREGIPFREAYKRAAVEYRTSTAGYTPHSIIAQRARDAAVSTGTPGNPNLEPIRRRLRTAKTKYTARLVAMSRSLSSLTGIADYTVL